MIFLSKFELDFEPVPASRARVPRFGKPYYTGRYAKYIPMAVEALNTQRKITFGGDLFVACIFEVVKPKKTKLISPRGDIDNYVKALFDAVTAAEIWNDDRQVTKLHAEKRFGLQSRTVMLLYER